MVPPAHLAMADGNDNTPMGRAFKYNGHHRVPIVQLLVLRGAPARPKDFPSRVADGTHFTSMSVTDHRRTLLAWADAELATRRTYVALVLGCGVHASRDLPPAQRSQLMKLRGNGHTDARMRIARCLGVRTSGAELRRLRDAAAVWRQLEEEEEEDDEEADY